MPNRLQAETSPYLRQHQDNPVDWYPWGPEAFAKATTEDKPIFLSIGYSSCHWCHVMAHESFEDAEVAAAANADFVCIKVDREERPDLDAVYMNATVARFTCSAFSSVSNVRTGGATLAAGSWVIMFAIFGSAYALAYFVRKLWL